MSDVVVDVHIHPIGYPETSVSRFVAASVRVLKTNYPALQFQVNPMSTTIVGPLEVVLKAVAEMHQAQFSEGAVRVSTSLRIDDRRDVPTPVLAERVGKVTSF